MWLGLTGPINHTYDSFQTHLSCANPCNVVVIDGWVGYFTSEPIIGLGLGLDKN